DIRPGGRSDLPAALPVVWRGAGGAAGTVRGVLERTGVSRRASLREMPAAVRRLDRGGLDLYSVPRRAAASRRNRRGNALQRSLAPAGAGIQARPPHRAGAAVGKANGPAAAGDGRKLARCSRAVAPRAVVAARVQPGGAAGAGDRPRTRS